MKQFVKFQVFMITVLLAVSCSEIEVNNSVKDLDYYMKFYGNYYNDKLNDIKVNQNDELVLAGHRKLTDNSERAWIIKTGANGMVEWNKTYTGANNIRGYGLHQSDTEIYFAGYQLNETQTTQKGFLYVYNVNGELKDSVSFNVLADNIKDIKFLTNKTNLRFIVHASLNGSDYAYIFETNSNNIVSQLSANNLSTTIEGSLYIFEQANGDIFLSGSVKQTDNKVYTDIIISKFADDNILWSRIYGDTDKIEKSSGIEFINNNLYVSATSWLTPESNDKQVYLMKIDPESFEKQDIPVSLSGNYLSYDMIVNNDDEFVVVGDKKIDANTTKIFMIRISMEGELLQEYIYGFEGVCHGRHVLNLTGSNKGFVIGGNMSTATDAEAQDVIVIKTDEYGEWIY